MADTQSALVDKFGRTITYVRLSVTDRCDFRCVYCMSEDMEFLPRDEVLSLEEIGRLARIFQGLGVKKIRLTGGEPLVRKDILKLIQDIGSIGLDDFTMTTNGSQLPKMAHDIRAAGMDRLNISLDSLDAEKFRRITRTGDLNRVIKGIDTAVEAGFKGIKLNSVIMKNSNDHEVLDLVEFARERGIDISFIEEMPLGEISDHTRDQTFCSSDEVREIIEQRHQLIPSTADTGGPSRYFRMPDSESRIGFISPHTHNFCGDCNRVRMTVEGRLLLCLGNEHSKDLRDLMREHPEDDEPIRQAIITAMDLKPREHHFTTDGDVQIVRFMNMTGG